MKFVHIADMHFDSPFVKLSDKDILGDLRRLEQRKVFKKIIEYIFSDKVIMEDKILSVGIVTLNLEQKTNIVNKKRIGCMWSIVLGVDMGLSSKKRKSFQKKFIMMIYEFMNLH